MVDNAVPTGDVALPGHVRADLAVAYKVLPNLALKLGVDNLFDQRITRMWSAFPHARARLCAAGSALRSSMTWCGMRHALSAGPAA